MPSAIAPSSAPVIFVSIGNHVLKKLKYVVDFDYLNLYIYDAVKSISKFTCYLFLGYICNSLYEGRSHRL